MLDQDAEEAFDGAEKSAVHHVGLMLLAVRADVGQVEALRQVEVELDGAQLPRPAERVLDLHVDLGPVEGAAALVNLVGHPLLVERVFERLRRLLPPRRLADGLRRLRREVGLDVVEAELAEHRLRELDRRFDLADDLLRCAEDVRVVLREAAHAEEAVANAVLLVAVDRPQLGVADGQVAVGAVLELVALDVERAVHGLDVVVLLVSPLALALADFHDGEHALLVEAEVTRRLPQGGLAHVRRVDDLVARLQMFPPPVVLDGHADARATRQPVREAGTHLLGDREEFELAPQEAVVALLRLLLAGDDRVHLGLVFRDHAVDALEHLVLLVAAIVGARHLREADDADLLRVLDVRPSAHLGVVADRVDGDRLALGDDVLQARELVSLPLQDLPRLVG